MTDNESKDVKDTQAPDNDLTRRMFSSFSHELKTPLASIIGSLEVLNMMNSRLSDEKRAVLIETSLLESQRLDRYVSNILELSRLELNLVNMRIEPIPLSEVLYEALLLSNRLKHEAEINKIGISEDIILNTDIKLLSRLVDIIIENAILHSAAPQCRDPNDSSNRKIGHNVKIDIWCENHDDHFRLIIRDYGIGLPIESFDEIFEKYARLKHEDRKSNGTGLGLSIAREIGKLLNIEIQASNHPKGGAMFKIIFNNL